MRRTERGGDGRFDILLGHAHRCFASSSPVCSRGGWSNGKLDDFAKAIGEACLIYNFFNYTKKIIPAVSWTPTKV
jgi:hypothetical protein